ncbi:hypothetical protein [Mesorhizobium sp. CAU 1741]|uniref:hypothetical protein n=1 Tax=Mesorhizobium sp. CAU 1741 TaxID=3140366 RepID=UPI00325AB134
MADMIDSNSDTIRRQQEIDLGHPLNRGAVGATAPCDRFAVKTGNKHPHRDYVDAEQQGELNSVDADMLTLQVTPDTEQG